MRLIDADELLEHAWDADTRVGYVQVVDVGDIEDAPTIEETCEGCKHFGKWENEVEYGYSSPCTCCKRRVADHYENEVN